MIVKSPAIGALIVATICGFALSPASASAQRISELRTVSPAPIAVEVPRREHSPPIPRADSEEKSASVAGLLSFLLPGAGSFYAGNSTHGWRHLLIEGGAFGAGFLVANTCNGELGCGIEVLSGVGVVLVGNSIWSIFSAVSDAHATKRPATEIRKDAAATTVSPAHDH